MAAIRSRMPVSRLPLLTEPAVPNLRPRLALACSKSRRNSATIFLDTHYAGKLSLNEVAQRCGISSEHLSRAFKRRYGITPSRYRDALRMDAANNLLRHSDLLIKEIAYRLGYPDLFTFSKAFRRHYHCAPGSTRLAIPKVQC